MPIKVYVIILKGMYVMLFVLCPLIQVLFNGCACEALIGPCEFVFSAAYNNNTSFKFNNSI